MNNHIFEEQIRKLISETQDELHRIDEQLKALEKQRLDLAEELHSYEYSLRGYLRRSGKENVVEVSPDWDELLKNRKTHKQRLITIAQHSGGELRLSPAVDILYNGKYIKSKSRVNAYIQLYNVIMNMIDKGELEKTGRARYKLTQYGQLL
jgi:septal ring factor EnvC (AmiA/AmiB activator)